MSGKIRLVCVREGSKLRIKFISYIDQAGKIWNNVYDNTLNCRFPKDLRFEGYEYEIPESDLSLSTNNTKAFYLVKKTNIRTILPIDQIDIKNMKIYDCEDCVVCLSEPPGPVFAPCGHKCCCMDCYNAMGNVRDCFVCRQRIIAVV